MVVPEADAEPVKEESVEQDLDQVLTDLKFSPHQMKGLLLIGVAILFTSSYSLSFTLSAADVDYRCLVPECETTDRSKTPFMPSWIRDAVPFKDDKPWKCKRFKPLTNSTYDGHGGCSSAFNTNAEEACHDWVFATNEVTIVNEFGILCEYRKWELSLIGTINNVGQFIGISFFGVVSDRMGRKFVILLCTVVSSIFGICRGLSTNYFMFIAFEFLNSFFASAVFITSATLGVELVNPGMRPLASTVINIFFPLGLVWMSCVAWYFQNWRKMLIVYHTPGVLFIICYWVFPESVRWLYMKGHPAKANSFLQKVSASNNIELPEKLRLEDKSVKCISNQVEKKSFQKTISTTFQRKHIVFRLLKCSFLWLTCTLIYYGLSINSVELIGHKYLNFILTCGIEVPGIIMSGLIMDKIRRRPSQSIGFFLSGLGCIICEFIPSDMLVLKMTFYLMSKLFITISFCILYVYTAEMFPTELRQTLCAVVSTFGRIGSMIAPHTVLLKDVVGRYATISLFGVVAVIAGGLSTTFPETLNKRLPDTIDDAKFSEESKA